MPHNPTLQHNTMGSGAPLVILHGLLGSKESWHTIMREFCHTNTVITPDLPNHGASFHTEQITHANMADSVNQLLTSKGVEKFVLLGHSLGGKIAMHYALSHPHHLRALIIIDIAPKAYPHTEHLAILNAMQLCAKQNLPTRNTADNFLTDFIPNPQMRAFILKNFTPPTWRCNVSGLRNNLPNLSGWTLNHTAVHGSAPCHVPTLTIVGKHSHYITDADKTLLNDLFPAIRYATLPTGHWVHTEDPRGFVDTVRQFLNELV